MNENASLGSLGENTRLLVGSGIILLGLLLAGWMSTMPFPTMAAERFYFTFGLGVAGFGVVYILLGRL